MLECPKRPPPPPVDPTPPSPCRDWAFDRPRESSRSGEEGRRRPDPSLTAGCCVRSGDLRLARSWRWAGGCVGGWTGEGRQFSRAERSGGWGGSEGAVSEKVNNYPFFDGTATGSLLAGHNTSTNLQHSGGEGPVTHAHAFRSLKVSRDDEKREAVRERSEGPKDICRQRERSL